MRASLLPFVVVVSTSLLASCRRSETGTAPTASASAAAAPGAATSAGGKSCPAGKWKYDYKDQFLETLSRNSSGARVVSEKGEDGVRRYHVAALKS